MGVAVGEEIVAAGGAEVGTRAEALLDANPQLERVLTVLKAGLASAPFAGGITSLLSDTIPSARFRRLEAFAAQIGEDLARLEARVSEERIGSEHFAYVFERSFRGVADEYHREKLDAFRGMLVNSAIPGDLSDEEQEYFLGLVSRLSVLHLRVLRFMAQPQAYLADAGIPESAVHGGFGSMFAVALPGVSKDAAKAALQDLHDSGLTNTGKSIFGTMTSASGLQLLRGRVSGLGEQFINYCSVPDRGSA